MTIALRTQQIIAYETGVTNTIDPLAGSYFIESLTTAMEQEAERYFEKIDALGGVIPAIEAGFFQREIAEAAYRYQQELDRKEKIIVGVNDFVEEGETIEIPILQISPEVERMQRRRLAEVRSTRDSVAVERLPGSVAALLGRRAQRLPGPVGLHQGLLTVGEMHQPRSKAFSRSRTTGQAPTLPGFRMALTFSFKRAMLFRDGLAPRYQ